MSLTSISLTFIINLYLNFLKVANEHSRQRNFPLIRDTHVTFSSSCSITQDIKYEEDFQEHKRKFSKKFNQYSAEQQQQREAPYYN